jgi:hypothetical protein
MLRYTVCSRCPTSTASAFPDSHHLNFSNRPVRTRMPGGVGGVRVTGPYPDHWIAARWASLPRFGWSVENDDGFDAGTPLSERLQGFDDLRQLETVSHQPLEGVFSFAEEGDAGLIIVRP